MSNIAHQTKFIDFQAQTMAAYKAFLGVLCVKDRCKIIKTLKLLSNNSNIQGNARRLITGDPGPITRSGSYLAATINLDALLSHHALLTYII